MRGREREAFAGLQHFCSLPYSRVATAGSGLKDQMHHKIVAIYHILLKFQYGIWTIEL